ncbi:MAG TPA: ferrous iron transport protein A [Candidatus Copromonas faecavium]|uniref:Ferrous iron transport protein A n=1 Tax=Candidatus Copromonas faecavium (nom. illeg.) TaxID=2840740 RepID=A0A9D1D4J1_9FIRM|nr:ferrous iron transport protein A [Candidatus Copromonas faecavium]
MMPLTFLRPGETGTIRRVSGADDTRRFLANLGFVDGSEVSVISELSGNLIVNIKDSRVAINKEMAKHVMLR